jgi:hypothetical protein
MSDQALREQLARLLGWEDAHAGLERIVDGVPPDRWGASAAGLPYTLWQLLEHLRLSQYDILDFCRNPGYEEQRWPEDYWPKEGSPPNPGAVAESVAAFRRDREALEGLARDSSLDLFARIPHGTGQTYLRELLLVADHTAYHLGQMIVVRRVLGIWD